MSDDVIKIGKANELHHLYEKAVEDERAANARYAYARDDSAKYARKSQDALDAWEAAKVAAAKACWGPYPALPPVADK